MVRTGRTRDINQVSAKVEHGKSGNVFYLLGRKDNYFKVLILSCFPYHVNQHLHVCNHVSFLLSKVCSAKE